jgi:hypothetical protein
MGMLALPRAANRSSRAPQGTTDNNRQAPSPTLGQVYPDWPLYRHAGRCDRLRVTVPPRWSLVRRSGPRHLLPPGHWPPRDQQAADARAGTAAAASPYAALGSARHRHFALRGMAGGASQIGQDRLQARGQTCCSLGQGNTAHLAAHGGYVADATWRADLAGCRLSWHVGRNGGAHIWPSSSRVHARCCAGDHVETIAERFIGHSIGQTGKRVRQATKRLMQSWWRTQSLSNLSLHPNSLVSGKLTGNSSVSRSSKAIFGSKRPKITVIYGHIPFAPKQGIFSVASGKHLLETGAFLTLEVFFREFTKLIGNGTKKP